MHDLLHSTETKLWYGRILEGWADYFDSAAETFEEEGTLLIPKESIRNTGYIHHWSIGKKSVFHMDPLWIDRTEPLLQLKVACTVADLKRLFGADHVQLEHTETIYYLHPDHLVSFRVNEPYQVRELTLEDEKKLEQLS